MISFTTTIIYRTSVSS